MNLEDKVEDFEGETSFGKLKFYDYLGDTWGLLICRSASAVSTTELSALTDSIHEFSQRQVKIVVLSTESLENQNAWISDILSYGGSNEVSLSFQLVADQSSQISKKLNLGDGSVIVIGSDKKVKAKFVYPPTTGQNVGEILRVLDSLQLHLQKNVDTPANWSSGKDCMVSSDVPDGEVKKRFPCCKVHSLPSGKSYVKSVPDPRFNRVLLPSWFVPEEYDITLHPNVDQSSTFRFEGKETISCSITIPGQKKISLHSKELAILSAKYEAGEYSEEVYSFEYDIPENIVVIAFNSVLPLGKGTLTLEFIGTHNNQMAGFYRSGYVDAEKKQKIMVSTQFEALDARRCFPCVDEPQAKAVFKATLIVDAQLTALSNMPEQEITYLSGGKKKKVSFLPSPKMSTYLLAFAVGEFDFLQTLTTHGVLVRVFTPPTKSSQGKFALEVASKALDLYDDFFGVPYPLPKMDMIAIPEFAMGAMENWGLVTYREVEVLIAEGASGDQKQRVATVITHELAHQWFGNLITMAWWDGLWLNEGFASWMETFAANAIFPDWEFWSNFVVDSQAGALGADALTNSHPIEVPIRRAEEVEEVFDAISYNKGACVVQLIQAYLGADDFRAGLQLYFNRHAYGNTETKDLWKAWADASGKPVVEVMASWTEQMGFPVLSVSKIQVDGTKFRFKVKQSWFLADGSHPEDWETKFWAIPLIASFECCGSDELQIVGVNVGLYNTREEKEFEIEANQPIIENMTTWVKLNAGQHVPMRVLYKDPKDIENLANAVRAKSLQAEDRAGLLLDAYALTKAGLQTPGQLLVLLKSYENEDNKAVWDAIEQVLNALNNLLRDDAELQPRFIKFAAKLVTKQALFLGWEAKPGDSHVDETSRSILVRLQCKYDPSSVKEKANELFKAFISNPTDPNSLHSNIKTPVLRVALSQGGKAELEALKKVIPSLETDAELNDVYGALGFTPNSDDKLSVLDWCTSGAVKLQDFFYPMGSVSGSGPIGAELTYQYMKNNFSRLHEMVKKASASLIMAVISFSCGGFASVERAAEIEQFFKENPVPLAARRVAQIVENTKANAAFLAKIKSDALFNQLI